MSQRDDNGYSEFKQKIQAIFFFMLLLSAVGLVFIVTDSNRIFASVATAKISRMLDAVDESQDRAPKEASPAPLAFGAATATKIAAAALSGATATPLLDAMPKNDPALTMLPVASISSTGACYSIENFKSDIQNQSAKALLASGPLREKSWAVSTPFAAQYAAGIETENAPSARRIAQALSARGVEPLSMSAKFVVLAKSDSEAAALELANASIAGLAGYSAKARLVANAGERRSLVFLAQTRSEIQFASSLTARLPGTSLSAVPCPQAAMSGPKKQAG